MGLRNVDQLADRIEETAHEASLDMPVVGREGGQPVLRCPPMLVFIDEVHQLQARVQDTLLPLLEPSDRTLRGTKKTLDASDVSFIVATTDWGRLREPFKSRLRPIRLEPYSVDEVSEMLRLRVEQVRSEGGSSAHLDPAVAALDTHSFTAISTAARAVPRVAIELLREVGMAIRIGRCGSDVEAVWTHLQRQVPCDRNGLTPQDWKYLDIVLRNGPVGLTNVANELGTDPSNVEGDIEPFLVQSSWVTRGPQGRVLTKEGRRLVATFRADQR